VKEADRRRIIRTKLARLEPGPMPAPLATGFAALDQALGGGFPRGAITELFGTSASGKTTLALQIAAQIQDGGGGVAWIDAERALDPGYGAALGIDLERLPILLPESAEQAFAIASSLSASGGVDLVVIDSAAALAPELELEAGAGERPAGLQSRVLASGLHRLKFTLRRAGTSVLFLNQTRTRVDASGERYESSAGGAPLKLHAAVRVSLERADGRRIRFRLLKTRASEAFAEGFLGLAPSLGFTKTP
jgi:recombination protein RecA